MSTALIRKCMEETPLNANQYSYGITWLNIFQVLICLINVDQLKNLISEYYLDSYLSRVVYDLKLSNSLDDFLMKGYGFRSKNVKFSSDTTGHYNVTITCIRCCIEEIPTGFPRKNVSLGEGRTCPWGTYCWTRGIIYLLYAPTTFTIKRYLEILYTFSVVGYIANVYILSRYLFMYKMNTT